MPVPKDSSVLEMSGKASGVGQYSDELTKQIEGLADTNPEIYQSAKAMIKGNNPEDRIKKMIESRLAPKQKVLTGTIEQDLNFVPVAKTFPEDPKMYLKSSDESVFLGGAYKYKDPNVKRADTANLFNSRMNYNNQPYSLEERNKFVRERPIHFNSVVLARQALTDSPDGQLTGKEIYNQIKNSQLKDGGVKDKELKDTGLDILKDSDDLFELSPNQKSLINISGIDISSPDKLQLTLTQNQIVSRSNFISDYGGRPNPTKIGEDDFDQIPFTQTEQFYVGESYPRMFEDNQRIGGESLAKQESLDYGIISINDPKSRFTAHISGDVPPEIAKGNIAWSRVSVREHPNGKKYLVPEEFQSDLHTKAQGTKDKPGEGYKLTEKEQEAADLDYENKSDIHNIEYRKLTEEIEKPFADSYYGSPFHMGLASELPDNLKPNYSVLGENANDIIRLKELHEDAIIDYLGDTSRTGDADNFSFWGGADREDANKAFNKVVIDISRSRSGEVDAGRGSKKKYYDSAEKYANARNNLIDKISKQKTSKIDEGLEADENYQQMKSSFDAGDVSEDAFNSSTNFRRGYLKNFQDELIEVELNTLSSKGINTKNQMFSKVTDLHGQIRDVIEPIEALSIEDATKFYRSVWKTVSDLKKDQEFKKFKQTRDELGLRRGEDETQAYIRNKFFEIADPDGELELKEHIELSMNERDFAQLISEIDSMVNPYTYASDVIRNLPYLEGLDLFRKNNPKDVLLDSVFELDQNSSNVKKYFETKKEKDKAFQKSIDVSDIPYSPLPQQSEWTKVLMRDLVRTAADRGLDGVVLPNAQAYMYAGGRTNKLLKGYKNTTIPAFKSVAKEIDADVETIEWKNWSSVVEDGLSDDNHLVIPVNKNLSGASIRGYKEGGRVGSLANVNVLDLGERVNG